MYYKLSLVLLAFALSDLGQSRSLHNSNLDNILSARALTPDNSCGLVGGGSGMNYTCDPTLTQGGPCCSANGYCGSSDAYCGTGCQPGFGTCAGKGDPKPSATATPTPNPDPDPAQCGAGNNNQKCGAGKCCSGSGWCGTGENYCSDPENCQFNFGRCDSDNTPAGTSTINDPRPVLGKVTYDNDIHNCVEPGVVALTYDDGPYQYTNQMLDVLKQFGFKATFFMTGNNLAKGAIDVTAPYPAIVKRMIAEGHQVASHTWSHYDLSTLTHDQRVQQMVKNERAIANLIGKYPTYMRPPYSSCDTASGCQADMKALGYHRTYFDLDTQDYLHTTPVQVQVSKDIVREYLASTTKPDYLSIQHDIHQQSVANLSSYYFDQIKAKGWKGVTVGECLQDPEENWYRVPGTGQGAPISHSTSSTTSKLTTTSTTSKTATTSTTSKSTSTSKATATSKATTTSSKSTIKSTTTTKPPTSTSNTPQPTSSCIVHQGTFCGTIPAFIGHPACLTSLSSCEAQLKTCPAKAGSTTAGKAACSKYQGDCNRLRTYCGFCGGNCKSTNPRYRTFVLQETA